MKYQPHTKSAGSPASLIPGLLYAFAIAVPAWFLGRLVPIIGGAVFAITFGLVAGSLFRPAATLPGIKFTSKKILQYSIILLGFEMSIGRVLSVGSRSLLVMTFTVPVAFLTAALFYRLLRIGKKTAILVGVGTCICGGSAIAATAPVIDAEDQDVAQSISTIFLFNIIAVVLFPALGRLFALTNEGFGIWAGTAINDTSSVVAAAAAWSDSAGTNDALELATIVKLTRTLLIIPITLVLALATARQARRAAHNTLSGCAITGSAHAQTACRTRGAFSFVRVFPWFVLGFLAAALANSFVPLPPELPAFLTRAGKFLIVAAMAAIGISTDVRTLIATGGSPILQGAACWFAVASVSLMVQHFTGVW